MSPASIGAEIVTCCRTMEPTLAAVILVGAMLALVRALLPPKVGQSAAPRDMVDVCGMPAQPHAVATAQDSSALWIIFKAHPPDCWAAFYRKERDCRIAIALLMEGIDKPQRASRSSAYGGAGEACFRCVTSVC